MKKFQNNQDNVRLDLFLKEACQISRKEAKKLLDAGKVLVNQLKVIIASWELKKGDQIALLGEKDITPQSESAKNYFLKVYHEDEHLIVVEKDAGIACETTPIALKPSLPEIIYQYLKRAHPNFSHPFVLNLHRLDQQTSGVMVYGKSKSSTPLLEAFKKHQIQRRYLAIVEGNVKKDQGKVDVSLLKKPHAIGRKMFPTEDKDAKKAFTEYRVLQRYQDKTLLEVILKTGRTHQVRAHLAYLGHPVVGDSIYGKSNKGVRSYAPALALHAAEISFIHPVSKKKMSFKSKPPKTFQSLITKEMR